MTLNCKGNLIDLSTPKVMGILNITPDSFYDGGIHNDKAAILSQTEKMLKEGATFIDVGAYSSRPGAVHISEEEELERIVPIVNLLLKEFPTVLLSIDTFRGKVADTCLNMGAALINDISAGSLDNNMLQIVAAHKVPYIMMHIKGSPKNMQQQTDYKNLLKEILLYFSEKVMVARDVGINDIIIDPGFGFAKTTDQNFELLKDLALFETLGLTVLIGLSRKSMIYKTLNIDAYNALNGTTALHIYGLIHGANILRVHDVKEAVECIKLSEKLKVKNRGNSFGFNF